MCFNLTLIYCIPFPWHERHHCNRQAVRVLQIRIPAVNPLCEHPSTLEWQWALSTAAQLAPNPSQIFFPQHVIVPKPTLTQGEAEHKVQQTDRRFCTAVQDQSFPLSPRLSQGMESPTGTEMERGSASLITSHNMMLARQNPSWTLLEPVL